MFKFMQLFIVLFLLSGTAYAEQAPSIRYKYLTTSAGSTKLLNAVALNATAATRTITLTLGKAWSKVTFIVAFTRVAATDVIMTPTISFDGTVYANVKTRSISAGASTLSTLVDTNAAGATETFAVDYDVRGLENLKIVFSGTSAGGSDLITVYGTAVTGY